MLIERQNDGTFIDCDIDGGTVVPAMMTPLSDATNAFELLDDVVVAIEHEPRRVNMGEWITRGFRLEALMRGLRLRKGPACHTAGCIGGHVVMLATGHYDMGGTYVEEEAAVILGAGQGVPYLSVDGLFCSNVYKAETEDGYAENEDGKPFAHFLQPSGASGATIPYGKAGYAQAVINRIRRFQTFYGDQLKAVKVTPVAAPALPLFEQAEAVQGKGEA